MTDRDAFKSGFLLRCAAAGLSPEDTLAAAVRAETLLKQASLTGMIGGLGGKIIDAGRSAVQTGIGYGVPLALATPPIVGGAAGYLGARATDIDDTDISEIKDREVLDEYRRQTDRLKRQKAVRDYQKQRARTGRIFL